MVREEEDGRIDEAVGDVALMMKEKSETLFNLIFYLGKNLGERPPKFFHLIYDLVTESALQNPLTSCLFQCTQHVVSPNSFVYFAHVFPPLSPHRKYDFVCLVVISAAGNHNGVN
jgi:hypothetical protein